MVAVEGSGGGALLSPSPNRSGLKSVEGYAEWDTEEGKQVPLRNHDMMRLVPDGLPGSCAWQVLIANNGMAATKSILSMRQWAYMELGDDRCIEFIVMATPEVRRREERKRCRWREADALGGGKEGFVGG